MHSIFFHLIGVYVRIERIVNFFLFFSLSHTKCIYVETVYWCYGYSCYSTHNTKIAISTNIIELLFSLSFIHVYYRRKKNAPSPFFVLNKNRFCFILWYYIVLKFLFCWCYLNIFFFGFTQHHAFIILHLLTELFAVYLICIWSGNNFILILYPDQNTQNKQ